MGKSFVALTAAATVLASSGAAMAAPDLRGGPALEAMQTTSSVETIAYTRRKTPTPSAGYMKSAGYSGGGLVGVLVSVATTAAMDHVSGSRTLSEHQLRDPSPDISQALAEILAQRRGAVVATEAVFVKSGKPAVIAKAAPDARYVVDVQTMNWEVAGMSTKKSQYPSSYDASLSVIDGHTGKLAVSANCHWASPIIKVNAEGLAGDKTEILRNHFAAATETCLEQFKITIRSLHLPGTPPDRESRPFAPLAAMPVGERPTEPPRIEHPVARPTAVAVATLPPAPPPPAPVRATPQVQSRPAPTVYAEAPRWEPLRVATPMPAYAEYPYARPYEAPPSKTRAPDYRYADGQLALPARQP